MEFADGVRVRIRPHFWWPQGAVGTVRPFPGVLEVPHVREGGGMVINPGGCTRPYQDTTGPRTMVWVVFDELARDFEGAGPYGQGEILSQYLEPAEDARPPENPRSFPGKSVTVPAGSHFSIPDGSLVIEHIAWGISCGEVIEPGDPDYEFWRWLCDNSHLFPEVNEQNMASARAAFSQERAERG